MANTRWVIGKNFWGMLAVAKKDMRLYYIKGPVVIFGLLFPLFLFFAFSLGRDLSGRMFAAPMLAMAVFFTSSSVGPIIAPWETRMRTLEKLMTAPISVSAIVLGGVLAGFVFGMLISGATLFLAYLLVDFPITNPFPLLTGMVLACFCFSSLGILLSAPPTDNPSNVMMLANLVKLPLIFISGVFVPLSQMTGVPRTLAYISPLTYFSEVIRSSLGSEAVLQDAVSLSVLGACALGFLLLAIILHGRNLWKRF